MTRNDIKTKIKSAISLLDEIIDIEETCCKECDSCAVCPLFIPDYDCVADFLGDAKDILVETVKHMPNITKDK